MCVRGSRGREDLERDAYAQILAGAQEIGGRSAVEIRTPKALTYDEYAAKHRRKACAIFLGLGETCERPRCGNHRDAHPRILTRLAS